MEIEHYDKFLNILPNLFSISIIAPILLYVSIVPTKNKILYIILFLIGLTYYLFNFNIVFFGNNVLFDSLNQLEFPMHPLKQLNK